MKPSEAKKMLWDELSKLSVKQRRAAIAQFFGKKVKDFYTLEEVEKFLKS